VRKEQLIKVNAYNEIKLDNTVIHIPKGKNHIQLFLVSTWNEFKVVTQDGEIIAEGPRPYMNKRKLLPWKAVFKSWILKPRVVEYSRYRQYLPGRIKDYLDIPSNHVRKQRLEQILSLLTRFQLEEINEDFYKHMVMDQPIEQNHPFDVNWNEYDQLAQQGGSNDARESTKSL
jgi:hypothetical protein